MSWASMMDMLGVTNKLYVLLEMFNIRISIVNPYFKDIWHMLHDEDADKPDIILVCNGRLFGSEPDNITHFTATRGAGVS